MGGSLLIWEAFSVNYQHNIVLKERERKRERERERERKRERGFRWRVRSSKHSVYSLTPLGTSGGVMVSKVD